MDKTPFWPDNGVILYDGHCALCSGWVRFVATRDVARCFRFTAIQSLYGHRMAEALQIDPDDPDTNAVVLDGIAFRRSDAALKVLAALPRWGWVAVLRFIPRPIRDFGYRLIARNRYRVFGRNKVCDLGGTSVMGRVVTTAPPIMRSVSDDRDGVPHDPVTP